MKTRQAVYKKILEACYLDHIDGATIKQLSFAIPANRNAACYVDDLVYLGLLSCDKTRKWDRRPVFPCLYRLTEAGEKFMKSH